MQDCKVNAWDCVVAGSLQTYLAYKTSLWTSSLNDYILIQGSNFVNTRHLVCRYGGSARGVVVDRTLFVSSSVIKCYVPPLPDVLFGPGTTQLQLAVDVSNDGGVTWSLGSASVTFVAETGLTGVSPTSVPLGVPGTIVISATGVPDSPYLACAFGFGRIHVPHIFVNSHI